MVILSNYTVISFNGFRDGSVSFLNNRLAYKEAGIGLDVKQDMSIENNVCVREGVDEGAVVKKDLY